MPAPTEDAVQRFRRAARGLGADSAEGLGYGNFIRSLDRTNPRHLALIHEATSLFRGAGYTAFDGEVPAERQHAAVAAPYAHVTAPLRRLVDRFALVVCEAVCRGAEVPDADPIVPSTAPGAHAGVRPPCPRRRAGVRRRHRGGRAPRTGGGDVHGCRPRPHREGHGRAARRAARALAGHRGPGAPRLPSRCAWRPSTSEPVRCPSSIAERRGHALPGLYTGSGRVGRTVASVGNHRRGRSGLRRAGWWPTATRGDPRDSATENRPPLHRSAGGGARVKRWCKRPPAAWVTRSAR